MTLEFGNLIYLQVDERAPQDDLIPGRVLWVNGTLVAIEIEVCGIEFSENQMALLNYEESHTFIQQAALIEGVIDREAADNPDAADFLAMDLPESSRRMIVVFRQHGRPVLAENRDCFRIKTHQMNLYLDFANRNDCELADISQSGFAVISAESLDVRQLVKVTIPGSTRLVTGMARIQSATPLRTGRFRYGVVAIGSELCQACAFLAMEFQRQRLRKLAGHC